MRSVGIKELLSFDFLGLHELGDFHLESGGIGHPSIKDFQKFVDSWILALHILGFIFGVNKWRLMF